MKIESINAYEFTCTPMHRNTLIRSCVVTIYAKNREEADEIFYKHAHQFFDQDLNLVVREFGEGGFRVVNMKEEKS